MLIPFISVCMVLVSPIIPDPDKKYTDKWQEVKNAGGVISYYRWIKKADGTPYRERKGELEIDCSFQKALKIITSTEYTAHWMSGIEECKVIGNSGKNEWYTYTRFKIPWPFSQRDLVSYNRLNSDNVGTNATIEMISRENHIPSKPDISRLTDYSAQWKISFRTENRTHITFTASSSAPPAFPRYLQDPVIERMFHKNLVRLKELLEL
jgi:hypothetical protein